MLLLKRIFLFSILFVCLLHGSSKASHVMGGDLNYRYLGGNNYEITYIMYRNCFNPNPTAVYPNPAIVDIRNASGTLIMQVSIPFPGSDTIPKDTTNPCRIVPSNVCVEVAQYKATVNLPPSAGGYFLFAQEYSRNAAILNVTSPGSTGFTVYTHIPDTSKAKNNSSPVFINTPPTFICVNKPIDWDFAATDADGDSLVYKLCTPYKGGTYTFPGVKTPFTYTPFTGGVPTMTPIGWKAPYSLANLMGGVPVTINSNTGFLTGIPNTLGLFVIGVCVEEYRNGVLINSIIKDFQYGVIDCIQPDAEILAAFGYIWDCSDTGISVSFPNTSTNATNYFWNFGDTLTFADTSLLKNPSYSYADTGIYPVYLVVEKGTECADTAYVDVYIFLDIYARFNFTPVNCTKIDIQFIDSSYTQDGSIITRWGWDFGDGVKSSLQNPVHAYADTGTYTVTLTVRSNEGCTNTFSKTVTIKSNPAAAALAGKDDTVVCSGSSILLGGSPTASGGKIPYTYNWNPSTFLNNISLPNPTCTPTTNASYILTITDSFGCQAKDTINITLIPSPTANVGTNDTVCFADSIIIGGTPTGSGGTAPLTYFWTPATQLNDTSLANPTAYPTSNITYYLIVTDKNNCSDLDSLRLIVHLPFNVDAGVDTTECSQTPVSLGGSPTASGSSGFSYNWTPIDSLSNPSSANPIANPTDTTTYIVSVTDVNNCTYTDTIILTIKPKPNADAGLDVTMCIGDSTFFNGTGGGTYVWTPATYLSDPNIPNPECEPNIITSLDYILTVTNIYNCIDEDTITVSVGTSISAKAGPDKNICLTDSVQLTVSGGNWYEWTPALGLSDSSIANPIAFPNDTTTYFIYATSDTCTARDTITVFVNPLPIASVGTSDTICINTDFILGGSPTASGAHSPYSYTWTPSTYLNDPSLANPTARPDTTTTYIVMISDVNNCMDIDTQTITISNPVIVNVQLDTAVCLGQSVQVGGVNIVLGGIPPFTYLWSPASGLSNSTISNPIATSNSTTDYILQVTDSFGCQDFDTTNINISFIATEAGTDRFICVNESTVLGGNPTAINGVAPYSYIWSPSINLNDTSNANPTSVTDRTGRYYVLVTDSIGCQGIDSIVINVSRLTANAGLDDTICIGETANIGGFPTADSGTIPYTYLWDNRNSITDSSISNPVSSPIETTRYIIKVTDSSNCIAYDTVEIYVYPNVNLDAGTDQVIQLGQSAQLNALPTGLISYVWTPDNTLNNPNIVNPVATPDKTTTYYINILDQYGCIFIDSVNVRVLNVNYQFPSGFTPNGDGINDIAYFVSRDITNFTLRIFNRWGEKVFETSSFKEGWNGIYKGKPLDQDTYTWYLKGKDAENKEVFDEGNIVLYR